MALQPKFLAGIGVLVLVIVALVAFMFRAGIERGLETLPGEGLRLPGRGETEPSPATGDVDNAVEALLFDANTEEALLLEEESDGSLISGDSIEVNELGESYDENNL